MRKAVWLFPLMTLAGCSPRSAEVVGQGTIEVEETDIVPTVRGRISRIWVAEGTQVHAGDTLVTLASATLPDDLHEREAQVARAEAEMRDLERGSRREEIARAEAELRRAIAEDTRAGKERERMDALLADKVVAGAEAGGVTRAALVSSTASVSAAEVVRERKTFCRTEPRSRSERASISPRIPRLPVSGSSVSTTEHLAVSGRTGSVGVCGRSSTLFQESVAENSSRPAVQVATVPAGSPVGNTVVSGLSALTRPRVWPTSLSGPPLFLA